MKANGKYFFIFSAFFLLTALDQFIKHEIRSMGGFYICNSGIAFGIKITPEILYFLMFIVIVVIMYNINRNWKLTNTNLVKKTLPLRIKSHYLPIVLILSGSISNMIDRIYFGCVMDYIDIHFWPIFNLADVFISIGAIMLTVELFKKTPNVKKSTISRHSGS